MEILFPVSSAPGQRIQENAGRLINAFAEPLGEGARAPIVRRRVAGLSEVATSSLFRCRFLHSVGTTLLAGFTGHCTVVDVEVGTITSLGALAGDGRVTVAHNNAATPNIVAVTSAGAFNLFIGSAPSAFADGDLPTSPLPSSVCFQDGYFFFGYSDGRIFASGLNAVTVDASHFTTAQSRPGGVTRLIPYNGQLFAFGPNAADVYANTGNPSGFPCSHAETIDKGLASMFAIAGFEDGWLNELIWVGSDDVVYHLDGYSPVPISTPDVVRSIAAVDDKDDLDALVYMNGAHAIWAISGPGFTWEFNLSTGWWNERKSYLKSRWRAQSSIRFDGDWIVGDRDSGKLFSISSRKYTENGDPLVHEVWSMPGTIFPSRLQVPRADFDFVTGVGMEAGEDPIETDPQVQISWSDNGGLSWSTPLFRDLGGLGEDRKRITLTRLGMTGPMGRQWKVVVADPVYAAILTGAQDERRRTP